MDRSKVRRTVRGPDRTTGPVDRTDGPALSHGDDTTDGETRDEGHDEPSTPHCSVHETPRLVEESGRQPVLGVSSLMGVVALTPRPGSLLSLCVANVHWRPA